jgi:hypothetical protein
VCAEVAEKLLYVGWGRLRGFREAVHTAVEVHRHLNLEVGLGEDWEVLWALLLGPPVPSLAEDGNGCAGAS